MTGPPFTIDYYKSADVLYVRWARDYRSPARLSARARRHQFRIVAFNSRA